MTATIDKDRPTMAEASPGAAFGTIVSSAISVVSAKVDDWSSKLEGVGAAAPVDATAAVDEVADTVAEGGGAKRQAGARGVKAGLEGKNPVWAAIKGAWTGGSIAVRAAVVAAGVALLLLLALSPVLLLVFLLSALVVAAASKARSASA